MHLGTGDEFLKVERREVANGSLVCTAVPVEVMRLEHVP